MQVKHKIWISDTGERGATIPLGVPLNQKYTTFYNKKSGKSSMRSSDKDQYFKYQIQLIKRDFESFTPIRKYKKGNKFADKNVVMDIHIYDVDNKRDIDATEKSILDAMKGILYEDDIQVWMKRTTQLKCKDKECPRVEIICTEVIRGENEYE